MYSCHRGPRFARHQERTVVVFERARWSGAYGLAESSILFLLSQAQNEGILTIATTNHPERIDDAILNRPSRFDVKYTFSLPTGELRKAYTLKWIQKLNSLRQGEKLAIEFATPDSELAEEVAKGTDGWSFAFLKEL